MSAFTLKEFKPTIFFLGKFLGLYIVLNLLYGWYVTAYHPNPDPATHIISVHTSTALTLCGWTSTSTDNVKKPTTVISHDNKNVLAIYEGCNGINVMIIFVAFLFSFGPLTRNLFWFIPAGLVVIHLMNILRVSILFWVALYEPDYMYFLHKYLFTAALYVVVFVLWILWVRKFSKQKSVAAS